MALTSRTPATIRSLIDQAGRPDPDALVAILLAPLAPDVFRYQREQLGISPDRIRATLHQLADRILGPRAAPD